MGLSSQKKEEERRREAEAQESQRIEKEKQEAEAKRQEAVKAVNDAKMKQLAAASAACKSQDYVAAVKILQPMADQGIPEAQGFLAQLYYRGQGVEKNDAKSVELFRLAAEQGNTPSYINLALLYWGGKGVEKDAYEALRWAEKAKAVGTQNADSVLANILNDISNTEAKAAVEKSEAEFPGDKYTLQELNDLLIKYNTEKEDEKTLGLSLRLASKGISSSELLCGTMYSLGKGTTTNHTRAAYWFEKAASHGNVEAQFVCGAAYQSGAGVAKDIKKALFWYEHAAAKGHSDAQRQCFTIYLDGSGESIKPDKEKAVYWIEKLAEKGKVTDQMACCTLYLELENAEKAFYWEEKAAEQGDALAQYLYGLSYKNGLGTEKDDAKALYWFEKSAKQGHADSRFEYGMHYYNSGEYIKALYWFEKSAAQGNYNAQSFCAAMYYNGKGTRTDIDKAIMYIESVIANPNVKNPELLEAAKRDLARLKNSKL